ncbi:MAG: DUF3106 domain-containing protein [Ramlibacter sp.]
MNRGLARRRAAGLLALCACIAFEAAAQSAPTQPPVAGAASARRVSKPESTPTWSELTPQQREALAPLTGSWSKLSEAHKRKWLALSANFPAMPPPEQARLHTRMAEWAALSPQQRTQARMNFAESKAVPAGDKKAKWEAYQALPPEEKRKLAAGARAAKPAAPPTAAAVQPEPRLKLAKPPREAQAAKPNSRTPRIAGTASAEAGFPAPAAPAPEQR